MTTTYRTPEWLGNLEVRVVGDANPGDGTVKVRPLNAPSSFTMTVTWHELTKVKPPLPPEPPVGAYRIAGVLCMRVSPEPEKCWVYQTADEMFAEDTFAKLCSNYGTDIVPLAPAPQLMAMPWAYTDEDGDRIRIEPAENPFLAEVNISECRGEGVQRTVYVPVDELLRAAWTLAEAAKS